jgi:hypothetical protein
MLLYDDTDWEDSPWEKAAQSAWKITLPLLRQVVTPVTSSWCYSDKPRTAKVVVGLVVPMRHLTTQPSPSRIANYIAPILAPSFSCAAAHGAFTSFNVAVAMHVIVWALVTDLIVNTYWCQWNNLPTDGLPSTFTLHCQWSIFGFELAETRQVIMSPM